MEGGKDKGMKTAGTKETANGGKFLLAVTVSTKGT